MPELACHHCFTINRVPEERIHDQPKCGKCGSPISPDVPIDLDGAHFDEYISHSRLPVVVDFWAEWCGPCKMMAPVFKQAAHELAGRISFVKVDSDAEQRLAGRYQIRGIPTMVLLRDGKEIARVSGAQDLGSLKRWLSAQGV